MEVVSIPWNDGNGNIKVELTGVGSNIPSISSDTPNDNIDREQQITYRTTKGTPTKTKTQLIKQPGLYEVLEASDGILSDSTGSDIWVLKSA